MSWLALNIEVKTQFNAFQWPLRAEVDRAEWLYCHWEREVQRGCNRRYRAKQRVSGAEAVKRKQWKQAQRARAAIDPAYAEKRRLAKQAERRRAQERSLGQKIAEDGHLPSRPALCRKKELNLEQDPRWYDDYFLPGK